MVATAIREVLGRPGEALDGGTRKAFEGRFGHDLSRIRIHADDHAAATARGVRADAYTVGQDIVFAPGRYAPWTAAGRRLLAHEIAHTLQEPEANGRSDQLVMSEPSDVSEQRALASAGTWPALGPPVRTNPVGVATLFRAIETACLAPSEIPGIGDVRASRLGQILEVPIMTAYCRDTGCAAFATDYFDVDAASYIAFVAAHNPHLTAADIIELSIAATITGGLSRPDILTHRPPRLEFEEIKPDSVSGRAAGRVKLASLAVLFTRFALPYLPGTTWIATGTQRLLILPGGVEAFLEWHRLSSGLVVYNLCVKGERSVLVAYGIVALLLAIALILLSRGRVLIPSPVLAATDLPPGPGGPSGAPGEGAVEQPPTAIA